MNQTRTVTRDDILKTLPEEKRVEYLKKCRKNDRRKRFKKIRHWMFTNVFNIIMAIIAVAAFIKSFFF